MPRRALDRIFQSTDIALAVVFGPGGCGKTLSLIRALRDEQRRSRFLCGVQGAGVNQVGHPISALVARWRGAPIPADESIDHALARVRVANVGVGPRVLVLALDGIDESPEVHRVDAEAIEYFYKLHQQPRSQDALLIVTCRSKSVIEDIIAPLGTGGPERREPEYVPLDEFTVEEFRQVNGGWRNFEIEQDTSRSGPGTLG